MSEFDNYMDWMQQWYRQEHETGLQSNQMDLQRWLQERREAAEIGQQEWMGGESALQREWAGGESALNREFQGGESALARAQQSDLQGEQLDWHRERFGGEREESALSREEQARLQRESLEFREEEARKGREMTGWQTGVSERGADRRAIYQQLMGFTQSLAGTPFKL